MSFEFPTFKVEAIEEAIKLKETATSDGKNNLPRSNSRTFSNCENEGITKTDDKQYKIIELSGFIYASYGECKKKRESIDKETRLLFKNLTRNATGDHKHYLDKSTKVNHIVYQFSNNGYISLTCYDWSKKSGYNDQLRLEIYSNEYLEWLKSLKS